MKLHRAAFRHAVTLCFPDGASVPRTAVTPEEGRRLDAVVDWGRRCVILKGRSGEKSIYRVLPFEVFAHFDVTQEDWPQIDATTDTTVPIGEVPAGKKNWFVRPE